MKQLQHLGKDFIQSMSDVVNSCKNEQIYTDEILCIRCWYNMHAFWIDMYKMAITE